MSLHEFLIDDEGRRWCPLDCPGERPHWNGEPEGVFEAVEHGGDLIIEPAPEDEKEK